MKELSKILLRFISLILGIEEFESFPPPLKKHEEIEAFKRMRAGLAMSPALSLTKPS